MKKVVIIGAGMGGLATALRLRYHGFEVTVLEKQSRAGGRSNVIEEQGFRADTGPTILVMKDMVEETYRSIGLDLDQRLQFVQVDPNYRIYFHDGAHIDLYSNMAKLAREVERIEPGSSEHLFRFIGESARKYELGMDFMTRNYDRITDLANPSAGMRMLRTSAHQNLYKQVGEFFKNDKLVKAFSFHSMFLGLSPFDSLAMYSLITYADLAMGMWYPMGGIYRIVEDMLKIGMEMGVHLLVNAPVSEIFVQDGQVAGVLLDSGEFIPADIVVSNADLPYTYKELIAPHHRKDFSNKRLKRMNYACSGYILFLGVDQTYPHIRHQSIYFSENYRANLDAIFKSKMLPEEPSFHLSVPTVTDPSLAPQGHTLLYVLAPMPNLEAAIDWDEASLVVRNKLLDQLEHIIDPDIRKHIVWERDYRPTDWQNDVNAMRGTAFGSLSQGFFQSAYFRPHNQARHIRGLYFVGQGTYPGIGVPMVHISARLVAERILSAYGLE